MQGEKRSAYYYKSKLRIAASLSEGHFLEKITSVFGTQIDRSRFHLTREILGKSVIQ